MFYHPKLAYWYALFALGELSFLAVIKMVEHLTQTTGTGTGTPRGGQRRRFTRSRSIRRIKRGSTVHCELTQVGREQFHGGRDPQAWWRRDWNGKWRFFYFDVPAI